MKTIFRYTNVGLLLAAILMLGAVAGFAQTTPPAATTPAGPCEDAELGTSSDAIRQGFTVYATASLEDKKKTINAGKAFLEKYGSCEKAKDLSDYLKQYLPGLEEALTKVNKEVAEKALTAKFDTGLKTKNYDDAYAAGRELLATNPDKFRPALLALGSIGYDESLKSPSNTKYNEDTLKYARQAIADLEGGKTFATYDLGGGYKFTGKDDALGWLNASIGYLTFLKNRKEGLPYLYKATQATGSEARKQPVLYGAIGDYYYDEVRKLAKEVSDLEKSQEGVTDPAALAQIVANIKAKVALVNGTAEAAIDAYARAHDIAKKDPKAKAYADSLYKTLQDLYNVRFGKMDGFDAFIAKTVAKPMPNPTNPVTPIEDAPAAPATATTSSTTPAAAAPAATETAKPATAAAKTAGGKTGTIAKKPLKRKAN